jgi:signal transduction histidine kinase/CheY-like chemotaxis protein
MKKANHRPEISINAESLSDVFAYRRSQKYIRLIFLVITASSYAYCYNLNIGLIWAAAYFILLMLEPELYKIPAIRRSPLSILILSANMIAFGWIALMNPLSPETSCLFLFAALLHTVVTSRRCAPAFLAGAIPIIILLAIVQLQAYVTGVPTRRLILIAVSMLIAAGFCMVVWNGYSKSLAQAIAGTTAKSAFLANMSHELRTPLNGVVGMASALQRTELSAGQQSMLGIISGSAQSLQVLVSDILDLAKIEAGSIDLHSGPLEPAALARHVAALFSEPARQKGLRFEIEIDAQSEATALGDSVRLTQILTNVCSNAIKFTASGGVKLSVKSVLNAHSLSVRFDVTDSGIGMSAEAKAQIFERFSQGDGSTTRRYGGMGLGLAISKHLVDLMGGQILVNSCEGLGSTFSVLVELPLADAVGRTQKSGNLTTDVQMTSPAPETAPAETDLVGMVHHAEPGCPDATQPDERPSLLLVEDHPTNRQVIQILLGDLVNLDMACDGAQGFEAAQRSAYDLILMDIQMPVMDGLAATRAIRLFEHTSKRSRTPIIMLSANAMPEHIEASIAAGADRHLAKPVDAGALFEAIDGALATSAQPSKTYPMAEEAAA